MFSYIYRSLVRQTPVNGAGSSASSENSADDCWMLVQSDELDAVSEPKSCTAITLWREKIPYTLETIAPQVHVDVNFDFEGHHCNSFNNDEGSDNASLEEEAGDQMTASIIADCIPHSLSDKRYFGGRKPGFNPDYTSAIIYAKATHSLQAPDLYQTFTGKSKSGYHLDAVFDRSAHKLQVGKTKHRNSKREINRQRMDKYTMHDA